MLILNIGVTKFGKVIKISWYHLMTLPVLINLKQNWIKLKSKWQVQVENFANEVGNWFNILTNYITRDFWCIMIDLLSSKTFYLFELQKMKQLEIITNQITPILSNSSWFNLIYHYALILMVKIWDY